MPKYQVTAKVTVGRSRMVRTMQVEAPSIGDACSIAGDKIRSEWKPGKARVSRMVADLIRDASPASMPKHVPASRNMR